MLKHLKGCLRSRSRTCTRRPSPPKEPEAPPPPAPAGRAPPYLPAPRRKTSTLFDLEALLSSIIDSHHSSGHDDKAREGGILPSYEELYKEKGAGGDGAAGVPPTMMMQEAPGFVNVQLHEEALLPRLPRQQPAPQPPHPPRVLRRKPKGLDDSKRHRSTREKALEALMRLLDRQDCVEAEEEEENSKPVRNFPSVETMGAVRRRALEGLRRRGWDVTVISRRRDGQGVYDIVVS